MKWINSAGGPFLFLASTHLRMWRGVLSEPTDLSDYDRACEVSGLIGMIPVGGATGIVLNDEPFQTTWFEKTLVCEGMLVRWRYAKNEAAIIDAVNHLATPVFDSSERTFVVESNEHILFDSALPGAEFSRGEFLKFDLPIGQYLVQTGAFNPDSDTSFIVHRFVLGKRSPGR